MRKTLYTLRVNDWEPELCKITFPLMQRYAEKIGASFVVIESRKWPDMPPVYEKFQIYDMATARGDDWSIFFDADTLIHPDFWDVTSVLHKSFTASYGSDFTPMRFRPDRIFLRDGRFIGKGNWCLIASDWCREIWEPLSDMTFQEAVANIYPTQDELNTVIKREHLIDDYVVSRNIAKYGLKHVLIPELETQYRANNNKLWHVYQAPPEQKIEQMRQVLQQWGVKL